MTTSRQLIGIWSKRCREQAEMIAALEKELRQTQNQLADSNRKRGAEFIEAYFRDRAESIRQSGIVERAKRAADPIVKPDRCIYCDAPISAEEAARFSTCETCRPD